MKAQRNGIKCQMLVTVSAVQVDHAGQALSQPQSRAGHQQVSTINIIQSYQCDPLPDRTTARRDAI